MLKRLSISSLILGLLFSCQSVPDKTDQTLSLEDAQTTLYNLDTITPRLDNGMVQAIIEIPAGTVEKWEMNKKNGLIERDSIQGNPRTINYLGYPGNYGMIPSTLLPKADGGDGDPLDILVIGPPVDRGTVVQTHLIGVLRLLDNGEMDDKLIGISETSLLQPHSDLDSFELHYPGMLEIIETWFLNYKGPGEMESLGFGNAEIADQLLRNSIINKNKKDL